MLEVITALIEEKNIINAIQIIPISAISNTRREILADDNKNNLIYILQKALYTT